MLLKLIPLVIGAILIIIVIYKSWKKPSDNVDSNTDWDDLDFD